MAVKRIGLSKKIRFEVFKRDTFKCTYCGSTPPNVVLEVDHIIPVAKGGANHIDNLVTSCFECNRGKSAIPLTSIPTSLKDKAAQVKEAEMQIKEYYKILNKSKQRIESEVFSVCEILNPEYSKKVDRAIFTSVKNFISKLGYFEVLEAMEIAVSNKSIHREHMVFKYFCGICWNKIKNN